MDGHMRMWIQLKLKIVTWNERYNCAIMNIIIISTFGMHLWSELVRNATNSSLNRRQNNTLVRNNIFGKWTISWDKLSKNLHITFTLHWMRVKNNFNLKQFNKPFFYMTGLTSSFSASTPSRVFEVEFSFSWWYLSYFHNNESFNSELCRIVNQIQHVDQILSINLHVISSAK